jgi:MYXO-CTERM domain-containing protein
MNKLNSTILAAALVGVAGLSTASADTRRDLGSAQGFTIAAASTITDQARVREENGVLKLRYTDEEFTNEQATVLFSNDGRRAVYAHMRTSPINEGTAMESNPVNQMQCALSALELGVDATGGFTINRPTSAMYDIWATDNDGNEYRNCNKPQLYSIADGAYVALEFNYQPEGTNDTRRYMKVFTWDLVPVEVRNANNQVQEQVVVMAKNNDDCDMHQSGAPPGEIYYRSATGGRAVARIVKWAGCNGNGEDDGWINSTQVDCATTGPASCTITRLFDASLAQREERSRGRCTPGRAGGPNAEMATCCWTEGNNQPQREGVWCAGVDLSANGQNGQEAQSRILWKERIQHRTNMLVNGEERQYYAMRMNSTRVKTMAPDGSIESSDQVLLTWGLNRGGNNNDKKGGRSDFTNVMVIESTRAGYTEIMPMTDVQRMLLGFDNTHVSVTDAVFGKGTNVKPGFSMMVGSQLGGLAGNAEMRTIMYDPATKELADLGQHDLGRSYDRHLYSNYLGNNPGNQGRNFASCHLVRNPYTEMNGNHVTYFQACAMTGKLPEHPLSATKPSATLTIFPVAFSADPPPLGGGWDEEQVPGDEPGDDPEDPPGGPGTSVGGCSTSGGANTLLLGLALGLATFIRRRK